MREYNIVILGAGGIGKSAIVAQYVQGLFLDSYDPTIEDSYRKHTTINGRPYTLEILDTAGIEQFTAMRELYIKNSEGFILAYSITNRTSFEELDALRAQVAQIKDNFHVPIVLVGNMSDLSQEREVSFEEGKALAARWGDIPFLETSAKTCTNIEQIFNVLVGVLVRRDSAIDSSFRNSSIYTHSTAESRTLSVKKSFARLKPRNMRRLVSVASLKPSALKKHASMFFGKENVDEGSRPLSIFLDKDTSNNNSSNNYDNPLDQRPEIPSVAQSSGAQPKKSKCLVM